MGQMTPQFSVGISGCSCCRSDPQRCALGKSYEFARRRLPTLHEAHLALRTALRLSISLNRKTQNNSRFFFQAHRLLALYFEAPGFHIHRSFKQPFI